MSDPDQPGEELDESVGADFPPDRPIVRSDAEDTIQPEVWERSGDAGPAIELAGDPDIGAVDDEDELVGLEVGDRRQGPLADDDEVSGDETARDVATERVARPAEEAALHIEDEPPGA
jgi:hypothetical protein